MPSIIKFIFVLTLLSLWGCSALAPTLPPPQGYKLLPPSDGPASSILKQRVTITVKEQNQQFLIISRLEPQRIMLVVLLPTGQKLLTLEYDGIKIKQDNLSGVEIPVKDILAIMQFSLWPETTVKQFYASNEGWITHFSSQQRELSYMSEPCLKISYQQQGISVDNFLQGYHVAIQTLEKVLL